MKGQIFMNNNLMKSRERVKRLVFIALFTALAYASTLIIHPKVMFLTFDVKDTVITLAAMAFGPVTGVVISFLTALIELISISETGIYGFIMNFCGSAVFSLTASLMYKHKKTLAGGIIGLCTAVFSMTAAMLLANILITPYFMKSSAEAVIKLIPTVLLPFNFLKALTNAALVIGFYKPVSNALKSVGAIKKKNDERLKLDKTTLIMIAVAVIVVAVSLTIMFNIVR